MYAKIENGLPVEWPVREFQIRNSVSASLPVTLKPEDVAEYGFEPYAESDKPVFNELVEKVEERVPAKQGSTWVQSWEIIQLYDQAKREQVLADDAAKKEAEAQQALIDQYNAALDKHLDTTAQSKRYTDRFTCAIRAGFQGPYQPEGLAFGQWMDTCNQLAYQMLAEIEAGTRPMFASTDEFIAALPTMVWPQ